MFEKIQLQFEQFIIIIVWLQTCTLLVFYNQTRHKNVYKHFEQKISYQNEVWLKNGICSPN